MSHVLSDIGSGISRLTSNITSFTFDPLGNKVPAMQAQAKNINDAVSHGTKEIGTYASPILAVVGGVFGGAAGAAAGGALGSYLSNTGMFGNNPNKPMSGMQEAIDVGGNLIGGGIGGLGSGGISLLSSAGTIAGGVANYKASNAAYTALGQQQAAQQAAQQAQAQQAQAMAAKVSPTTTTPSTSSSSLSSSTGGTTSMPTIPQSQMLSGNPGLLMGGAGMQIPQSQMASGSPASGVMSPMIAPASQVTSASPLSGVMSPMIAPASQVTSGSPASGVMAGMSSPGSLQAGGAPVGGSYMTAPSSGVTSNIPSTGNSSVPWGGGTGASSLADPFASQRNQYQSQLQQLMTNGIGASNAGYNFALNQGIGSIDRSAAAGGTFGSGNQAAALMQYGQGMASQQYLSQANLLSLLSGATTGSPAAAGNDYALQQASNNGMIGQGLSALTGSNGLISQAYTGAQNLLNGGSSSTPSTGGVGSAIGGYMNSNGSITPSTDLALGSQIPMTSAYSGVSDVADSMSGIGQIGSSFSYGSSAIDNASNLSDYSSALSDSSSLSSIGSLFS